MEAIRQTAISETDHLDKDETEEIGDSSPEEETETEREAAVKLKENKLEIAIKKHRDEFKVMHKQSTGEDINFSDDGQLKSCVAKSHPSRRHYRKAK